MRTRPGLPGGRAMDAAISCSRWSCHGSCAAAWRDQGLYLPDYYGVTFRNPHTRALQGIDIDLSRAFAEDLGVNLTYVDSSFTSLGADLNSDRCDIAMFAVGVSPQRAVDMVFSEPYLRSDIYGMTTKSQRAIRQWEDIDQPGILVGQERSVLYRSSGFACGRSLGPALVILSHQSFSGPGRRTRSLSQEP